MTSAESEPDSPQSKLALQVKDLLWKKGHEGLEIARDVVLQEEVHSKPLQEAMSYFMASWQDVFHPALITIACETVGSNSQHASRVGAALLLLAGGADIHDDIIDDSIMKYGRKTVLGKFGKELAILTGDALITLGFCTLHDVCNLLPSKQDKIIFEITRAAFFRISGAEAKESELKKESCKKAEDYFDMIMMKASVAEATARIGAVLGEGSTEEAELLAGFGKTFGLLMSLKDEFIDIFELEEMRNRTASEWLPLPILYAIKNTVNAEKISKILLKRNITQRKIEKILEIVVKSKEVKELKKRMLHMVVDQEQKLKKLKRNQDKLMMMLQSGTEDL